MNAHLTHWLNKIVRNLYSNSPRKEMWNRIIHFQIPISKQVCSHISVVFWLI